MSKIKLIFGTTNSQPYGNHEYLLEKAYQESYKPFLSILYKHPKIKTVLHYSGFLLSWFEDKHPEFIMLLKDLVKRKQVELLGGGYYDPVLSLIPVADRLGQVEALTTHIRKTFGKRPRGAWITELVWEPSLTRVLNSCGMDYVFLDENHFKSAGSTGDDLRRPCISEDQGKIIKIFPVARSFVRDMLKEDPKVFLDGLISNVDNKNGQMLSIIDSGERFGLWNSPDGRNVGVSWLEEFLQNLEEQDDIFEFYLPGQDVRSLGPLKKMYFRCTSYEEMMSWGLQPDKRELFEKTKKKVTTKTDGCFFLYGGFFRQFLSRYPESNYLYSKMVYTQVLVNQIRRDKYRKKAAREELWKAQNHFPYWHGKCGGLYVNHLRKASYSALIEAEKITRQKGVFIPSINKIDFDMDGIEEYLYQGQVYNAYVHPKGGQIFELDFLPKNWNYLDTLSRHREEYHTVDFNNAGYDQYPRRAFIDHIFSESTTIQDFYTMDKAQISDLVHSLYQVELLKKDQKEILFTSNTTLAKKGKNEKISLKKKYIFKKNAIDVYYSLLNEEENGLELSFGVEINLSFASNNPESLRTYRVEKNKAFEMKNEITEVEGLEEFYCNDLLNDTRITISASNHFTLWSFPVETMVKSYEGEERYYQSNCFILKWDVSTESGNAWETRIELRLDEQ